MKYLILVALILATGLTSWSQSSSYELLQSAMTNKNGAMVMSVSKEILSMVEMNLTDDSITNKKITGSLNEVKLLICSSYKGGKRAFTDEVISFLPKRLYDEVKEDERGNPIGDGDAKIMVMRKGLKIKECHLILGGEASGMVVSFFGDFHLRDLKALSEKAKSFR